MIGYYDYRLVTLSIPILILGAYPARDLYERASDSRGRAWLIWLVCGATVDGISTWLCGTSGCRLFLVAFSQRKRVLR